MYCKFCGTEMNIDGKCPKCGNFDPDILNRGVAESKPKKKKHIFRKIVLGVIAVVILSAVISGMKDSGKTEVSATQPLVVQATARPTVQPIEKLAETSTPAAAVTVSEPTAEPTIEPATEKTAAGGVRPEFQAAMDSYKDFFSEYVTFMQNYMADPSNMMSMMGDYMNMMTQYSDTMAKMEAIDESELTPEEDALYIQTMADIDKMLLSVAG